MKHICEGEVNKLVENKGFVPPFKEKLFPWQVDFEKRFFEEKQKRYWTLIVPVGLGKTRLAMTLIKHELESDRNKRVLVLAPMALLQQYHRELSVIPLPTPPLLVDRKTFLELESSLSKNENFWPVPAIILMSTDFAKKEDIEARLSSVVWDLVIIDESHKITGKRQVLLNKLKESGAIRRALLMSSIDNDALGNLVTKVIIDYKDLVDWNKKPIFPSRSTNVIEILYNLTTEEQIFLKQLHDFANQLTEKWRGSSFQVNAILRTSSSSFFATQAMLQRIKDAWTPLRNKIAHQIPWVDEDLIRIQKEISIDWNDEPDINELTSEARTSPPTEIESKDFLNLYQQLDALIDQLENVHDSKMDCLIEQVETLFKKPNLHVALITSFPRTADYINANLQGMGIPVHALPSYFSSFEFSKSLTAFGKKGGLLVASDNILPGIDLNFVDAIINYDLPANPQIIEQRIARFVGLGDKRPLKIINIISDFPFDNQLLRNLDEKLSSIYQSLNIEPIDWQSEKGT